MYPTFFQVGVVVESLESARAFLAHSTGAQFTDPQTVDMHVLVDGAVQERQIEVCFSRGQLPHLELIAAAGSPWNIETVGFHHLAAWSDDVEADIQDVLRGGGSIVARRVDTTGRPAGFAYVRLPGGLLVELLDVRRKAQMQAFMGAEVLT